MGCGASFDIGDFQAAYNAIAGPMPPGLAVSTVQYGYGFGFEASKGVYVAQMHQGVLDEEADRGKMEAGAIYAKG